MSGRTTRSNGFGGDRAEVFVMIQTLVLVLVATWSLGGRLDGAIFWIGALGWTSLAALAIDPDRRKRLPQSRAGRVLLGCWALVLVLLVIAPLNPQLEPVDFGGGQQGLEPLDPVLWLPSALVAYRAAEYGFLLSGVLVQALVLWSFLRSRRRIRALAAALAVNGLVLAIVGTCFKLAGTDRILGLAEPVNQKFFSSFRYHNHWVAFALLSMGQCAALMVYSFARTAGDPRAKKRRPDVFWFCALVLVSITLTLCESRTGILFFSIFWTVALLGAFAAFTRPPKDAAPGEREWFRTPLFRGGAVAVVALAAGGYVFLLSGDRIAERFTGTWEAMENYHERQGGGGELDLEHSLEAFRGVLADRLIYSWVDTWSMIEARPVTGWGFGCHKYAFYFFTGDHYRNAEGFPIVHKEFAHNDWLQYLAELGFLGFAALVAVPLTVLVRLRLAGPPPLVTQTLLFPAGLVLLMALFEFPLSNPAVLTVFAVQTTAALAYWRRSGGSVFR